MYSFGYFPGVRLLFADVSEPSISSIFKGFQPLKMETDRGFRNVGKQQSDAGEIPKRIIQYLKNGESLKSRIHLYMFRSLCAHHQEVKIVLYSVWYHHTCRWPSGAPAERRISTCAPDRHLHV